LPADGPSHALPSAPHPAGPPDTRPTLLTALPPTHHPADRLVRKRPHFRSDPSPADPALRLASGGCACFWVLKALGPRSLPVALGRMRSGSLGRNRRRSRSGSRAEACGGQPLWVLGHPSRQNSSAQPLWVSGQPLAVWGRSRRAVQGLCTNPGCARTRAVHEGQRWGGRGGGVRWEGGGGRGGAGRDGTGITRPQRAVASRSMSWGRCTRRPAALVLGQKLAAASRSWSRGRSSRRPGLGQSSRSRRCTGFAAAHKALGCWTG
jgi:hypothetical protein